MIYLKENKINKFGNNKIYLKDKVIYQAVKTGSIEPVGNAILAKITVDSSNLEQQITSRQDYFNSILLNNETEILTGSTVTLEHTFSSPGTYNIKYIPKDELTTCYYMFRGCEGINEFNLDNFNSSKITSMEYMFAACGYSSISLKNLDTSNVTNMKYMFASNEIIETLDINNFNTSNVTDMSYMFNYMTKLSDIKCNNLDTSSVTNISFIFQYDGKLSVLDLSGWNTSNVTNIQYAFDSCSSLTDLYVDNFDMSKVTEFNGVFQSCNKLNHIRCKQAFQDWCITNQTAIRLPAALREGGDGTWEIVE